MNLTSNEMNFMCNIIDVKKLPGYELFPILSIEETKEVIKSLKDKKILEDSKLSKKGLQILEIMSLYNNSKKYLKLGKSGVFANYQDREYVLISEDEEFNIEMVNEDQISAIILSKLKGWKTVKDGNQQKKIVLIESFKKMMEDNKEVEAIYYYKTDIAENKEYKAVIFINDGYFQHYETLSEELNMYPRELVQQGIEIIFS